MSYQVEISLNCTTTSNFQRRFYIKCIFLVRPVQYVVLLTRKLSNELFIKRVLNSVVKTTYIIAFPCYNTVTKKKQLPKVTAARRKEMMKNEKNRCKRRRYDYGSPAYLPGRLGRNVADFRHHQPAGDLSKQASAKKPPSGGFFVFGLTKTIC